MTVYFKFGNIFDYAGEYAIVNPVNTAGVMGKGLYMAFYDKSDRIYFVSISFTDNGIEVEQSVRERGQIEVYRLSKFMSLNYAVPGTLINDAHAYRSWKES